MHYKITLLGLCLAAAPLLAQVAPAPTRAPRAAVGALAGPRGATDPNARIGGELQQLYQQWRTGGAAAGKGGAGQLAAAFPQLHVAATDDAVLVRITAQDVAALRPALLARGFVVVSDQSKFHFIEGRLPVSQLAPGVAGISALAAQGLLGVLPIYLPAGRAGKVLNQADFVLEAARVRGTRPGAFDGTGVRVGVMSDSYNALNGAPAGVASGDLPAAVQVLQEYSRGTDEGRAMIELVHDIAPGAGKAFSSVYFGEADFANQIARLASPTGGNCKILVDDIGYFAEPLYQDGVVAQAIEAAVAGGAAYYSAAGNQADEASEYVAPTFTAAAKGADLDFGLSTGATTDTRQPFTIPASGKFTISLQWSDPFYTAAGVKTDLDAYLVIARVGGAIKGDTVATAANNNIASQAPYEILSFTNGAASTNTAYNLIINRRAGTATPARVKYASFGESFAPTKYWTHSGTITGHAAAASAMAVAAAPSFNRLAAESFSSIGAATILFNPDGSALGAPATRQKPDFTSIDYVSTTFFTGTVFPDPADGFIFAGTSAAAPNAAAVAALLLQARPTSTPAQLNAQLKATALDLNTPGFDVSTGVGLINAYAAVYGLPTAAAVPFVDVFDGAALGPNWSVTSRGAARVAIRSDFAPASSPGHLVLDSFFPYYGFSSYTGARVAQADLRLNLANAPAGGALLTFRHKKILGEIDQVMPATFTGSSDTDGVALSVDGGTTWYSLVSITGTSATTDYQTVSVNLTQFAATNGLALGADVRIRFQRTGTTQVDAATSTLRGGRAFDDVAVTGTNAAPVALFNVAASAAAAVCPGTAVQFADASLLGPSAWSWSFPGGTPATSAAQNPSVTYARGGTYDVTLTVTNANGTATRTAVGAVVVSSAVPVASFTVKPAPVCVGGAVTFTSTSGPCPSAYAWSFPGGTPTSSTAANPVVTYAAAGAYTATLVVSNGNGTSAAATATVAVQGSGQALPYAESLASGIPATWTVANPDNALTWGPASNVVRKDGSAGTVAAILFYNYSSRAQRDTLRTPAVDLRGQAKAFLRFDLAYAAVSAAPTANNDSLAVDVYTACTSTRLGRVYLQSAATGLGTTAIQAAAFLPSTAAQWRTENVDLTAFAGQQVYFRFTAFNEYGNNLYLANVRVENTVATATRALADSPALQVYPNPVAGGRSLALALPLGTGTAALRLVDALGRTTWHGTAALSPTAATRRTLDAPLAAGLYTVLCQAADGQLYSHRVVVE
ncbi:MAG: PKD domain-containing protein [Janthinobacterium lividum]